MSGSWMDRRTGLWPRWIENAVPILVTSSLPDNQLDCVAARMAEARQLPRVPSRPDAMVVWGGRSNRPLASGRMIFHHATRDNMSLAARRVMVM